MYTIVIPGKLSAVGVVYPTAADALKKYREMEAQGLLNIDVRDAKGGRVGTFDLQQAANEASDADRTERPEAPPT